MLATAARTRGKWPKNATAISQYLARRRLHSRYAGHSVGECYDISRNLVAPCSPTIQPCLVAVFERAG